MLLAQLAVIVVSALACLAPCILALRLIARRRASCSDLSRQLAGKETIAFFHPYAHAGGGGERVLWCAIRAVQRHHPGVCCVVYTGDLGVTPGSMLANAKRCFGIELAPGSVFFVFLRGRRWVDAATWPRFTLLGQSLGSLLLGWEALCQFRPSIYIDSMGYAFTLPLFALIGGCRRGCYVHYPTISTDMLAQVRSRDVAVCNDTAVARSWFLSFAKLLYYKMFARIYGIAGSYAEVVLVNSSWTRGHIDALWRVPDRIATVYPPCDTAALAALPLRRVALAPADWTAGGRLILSLAQFRPEKDHPLQLRAFAAFLKQAPACCRESGHPQRVRLVMAGGCRDGGDRGRVEALQRLCAELGLQEGQADQGSDWDVTFRTNVPLDEMRALLGRADVGLHTMRDEHFGISVVEFMASGAVVLAHDSAGPAMDIVTPFRGQRTGYLAKDEAGYAEALVEILLRIDEESRARIAAAAREAVLHRFAEETFEDAVASRLVAVLRNA